MQTLERRREICAHIKDIFAPDYMEKNYTKVMQDRRREQGLCCNCGKPNDREGFYCTKCKDEHNRKQRESAKWYLEHSICPRCKKEELFGDEKRCLICNYKSYNYTYKKLQSDESRINYNKNHSSNSKKRHHEAISLGICTRCRKRKADNNYKTCGICREKQNKTRRETLRRKRENNGYMSREERVANGLCSYCGNPIKPGYKICEYHYQINVKNANCEKSKEAREVNKKKYYLKYGGL